MTDLIALLSAGLGLPEQDVRAALVKLLGPQVLAVHAASVEAAERAAVLEERHAAELRRTHARTHLRARRAPP